MFQPYVCNGCPDTLMSVNLKDIAILNNDDVEYGCTVKPPNSRLPK